MRTLLFTTFLLLAQCSNEFNINKYLTNPDEEKSLSYLTVEAQKLYDEGKFVEAQGYIEKAEALAPLSEEVSILYGYIHLAVAGIDTFSLAKTLLDSGDSSSLTATSDASSLLVKLRKSLLDATNEDFQKLGTLIQSTDLTYFSSYDLISPMTTDDAVEAGFLPLSNLNKVVKKMCSYVKDSVLSETDTRHTSCVKNTGVLSKQSLSHFLWAFAHLGEAMIYFGVVQYQEVGVEDPNIKLRADALDGASTDIVTYANHIIELASNVDAIFSPANNSMFSAVLNGLQTVALAFAEIGNLPAKMKNSITDSIDSITDLKESVSGGSEDQKESNAFKNQINSEISNQLSTKITEYAASDPSGFAQNKSDLCGSYTGISGGASAPEACN